MFLATSAFVQAGSTTRRIDMILYRFDRNLSAKLSRLMLWPAAGLATVLICLLFLRVSTHFPKTTDQANFFMAGAAVAHGNVRLVGWNLPIPNFLTSDIALSAILVRFAPLFHKSELDPLWLALQPALSWTVVIVAACAVTWRFAAPVTNRACGLVIVLCLLCFPVLTMKMIPIATMLSAMHVGTAIYGLLGFAIIASTATADGTVAAHGHGRGIRLRLAVLGCLIFLGAVEDDLFLYTTVFPAMAALAFARFANVRRSAYGGPDLLALATVTVAATLAHVALWVNRETGGFNSLPANAGLVSYGDLGANVAVSVHGTLQLLSADFFGRRLGDAIPELLHLPLWGAAMLLPPVVIDEMRRNAKAKSAREAGPTLAMLHLLLATGVLFNLAALVMSDRPWFDNHGIQTARYLIPMWVYSVVLLATRVRWAARAAPLGFVAAVAAIIVNWPYYAGAGSGPINEAQTALVRTLLSRNFDYGIASYWDSGILEYASAAKIRVDYFVAPSPEGGLEHRDFIHPVRATPDLSERRFFVILTTPPQDFTEANILKEFGPPKEVFSESGYRVFVYTP